MLSALADNKGKERHMTRSFDGLGQPSLMIGASAGATTSFDFAKTGQIFLQILGVLVVNLPDIVGTKWANFTFHEICELICLLFCVNFCVSQRLVCVIPRLERDVLQIYFRLWLAFLRIICRCRGRKSLVGL